MEGHQRNLYLYDRFNARVAGVSRNDVQTLKFWADDLGLTFPVFSNTVGHLGMYFGLVREGYPMFSRGTAIIDKWGTISYLRYGSPDYHEILQHLKELHEKEQSR